VGMVAHQRPRIALRLRLRDKDPKTLDKI
jgi:hypothetical protein